MKRNVLGLLEARSGAASSEGFAPLKQDGVLHLLTEWEALVADALPEVAMPSRLPFEEGEELSATIRSAEIQFRESLFREMVTLYRPERKQELVRLVQLRLTRLVNACHRALQSVPDPNSQADGWRLLGTHFQALLRLLEDLFAPYTDDEADAPLTDFENGKTQVLEAIDGLQTAAPSAAPDEPSLLQLLAKIISAEFSSGGIRTVGRLRYVRTLVRELITENFYAAHNDLSYALYALNFNHEAFLVYEFERLFALVRATESKRETVQVLRAEQKRINQLPRRPDGGWCRSMPPLVEQVSRWIEEELRFVEGGQPLLSAAGRTLEDGEKIQTSLSVAKLAVLIRLLVLDKIIINRSAAPMLRTVAKVFTTLQRDEISFGSLETKYHAPEKATVQIVRDMLFKWINILAKI